MADVLKKVPVREQEPKVRATNFEEVCYGYNKEEAMEEATRCLNCKNADVSRDVLYPSIFLHSLHRSKMAILKKLTK